jgi:hypothetical protein
MSSFSSSVHAGKGLVKHEQAGLARERPAQLHAFAHAIGQGTHELLPDGLHLQEVDDLLQDLVVAHLLALTAGA